MVLVYTMYLFKQYGKLNGGCGNRNKTMSWNATQFAVEYLDDLRLASGSLCNRLMFNAWRTTLMAMPLHYILEPLKTPLRNVDQEIFRIPYDTGYFLDILGRHAQDVLTSQQLRTLYTNMLQGSAPMFVWLITNVHTGACCALLHFTAHTDAHTGRLGYHMHRLYVSDQELQYPEKHASHMEKPQHVHEVLLHALCTFAEQRNADVHFQQNMQEINVRTAIVFS